MRFRFTGIEVKSNCHLLHIVYLIKRKLKNSTGQCAAALFYIRSNNINKHTALYYERMCL